MTALCPRAFLLARRLRSLILLAVACAFGPAGEASAQQACENQSGYCKVLDDSACGVDYVQDDGVSGCSGSTVCCLPKLCSTRGGLCQQTATCGALTSLGSTPGCPSCREPPPYTAETCGQKGGDLCSQDLSCPAGATPKGASTDCVMCCASSGATGTCDTNQTCAANEPCTCSDCSTASRCQGGSGVSTYRVEYLHTDALGSVRLVTGQDGEVVSRQDYYPFGGEVAASLNDRGTIGGYAGDPNARQRFTGKERDGESQLDYFGARYYSAAQGRFTTPDAPFADQRVESPQSWNLYVYTWNNPQKFVDEDGRGVKGKALKALLKGGDVAATFADLVDDLAILTSADPRVGAGVRTVAVLNGVWELSPGSDAVDAGRFIGARLSKAGSALEGAASALLGLGRGTGGRILEGTASGGKAFRNPDFRGSVEGLGRIVGEVKDVGYQHLSRQLKDTLSFAKDSGEQAMLFISQRTQLSSTLAKEWVSGGGRIVRRVGDDWMDLTDAITKQLSKEAK